MEYKQENGHPTGDHGESKKWFPQETGEKGAGNVQSFRDRGVAAIARALRPLELSPGTLELQEHTAPEQRQRGKPGRGGLYRAGFAPGGYRVIITEEFLVTI